MASHAMDGSPSSAATPAHQLCPAHNKPLPAVPPSFSDETLAVYAGHPDPDPMFYPGDDDLEKHDMRCLTCLLLLVLAVYVCSLAGLVLLGVSVNDPARYPLDLEDEDRVPLTTICTIGIFGVTFWAGVAISCGRDDKGGLTGPSRRSPFLAGVIAAIIYLAISVPLGLWRANWAFGIVFLHIAILVGFAVEGVTRVCFRIGRFVLERCFKLGSSSGPASEEDPPREGEA